MFHPKGPTVWELARQALSSTEQGYDLLAPKFDYTPFRTPEAILRLAAAEVGAPVDQTLDLACGTGAAMEAFRPVTRDLLVGVDRSAGMLAQARAALDMENAAGVECAAGAEGEGRPGGRATPCRFVRGDLLALPVAARFDLALCFGAFGHVLPRDEPRFVAEIHRVLRPGGRFLFVTGYAPPIGRPAWWVSHGFNLVMRVRNALWRPPFIMYYLTFLLPRAQRLLEAAGFTVEIRRQVYTELAPELVLVIATRSA